MTFGERLRKCRKEKGLTQKELAALIGARHTSISHWEKNQNIPDGNKIVLLIKALDVSPDELIDQYNLNELSDLEDVNDRTPAKLTNEQRVALEYAKAVSSEIWGVLSEVAGETVKIADEVTRNIIDVLKDFAEEEKLLALKLITAIRSDKRNG